MWFPPPAFPREHFKKKKEIRWPSPLVWGIDDGQSCVDKSAVGLEKGGGGHPVELVAALEEGDLEDEEVADQRATELLDEGACSGSGSA